MPMPRAWRGKFSPDGKKFAYEMVESHEDEWRNYRGGQNKPIWVLDLDDYSIAFTQAGLPQALIWPVRGT